MSANNIDMSKIKQVMRLMLERGDKKQPSNRCIGEMLGIYKGTVNDYVNRIKADPMDVKDLLKLEDPILERRLCAGSAAYSDGRFDFLASRMDDYHKELLRPHVTLQILYEEYCEATTNPYSYSQFCFHMSQHKKAAEAPTIVLSEHREGGKEMMVDFAGDKLQLTDKLTGEKIPVELYVSTLPASDYPFAIAVPTQKTNDFIHASAKALEFYGGVPRTIITDNLKSAVIKADRYQPEANKVFEDFCNHYGMVHLPARAYKPRDKALVENHVRIIYQRVYAALRNRIFYTIEEMNEAIEKLMEKHRQRRMKEYGVTRQERFLAIDKPALSPLPQIPFEIKCYAEYTVGRDSYIKLGEDGRYYSVPYAYKGKKVRVIYTATTLTVYYQGETLAVHSRLGTQRRVTIKGHLPSHHEQIQIKDPSQFIYRASLINPNLGAVVEGLFKSNPLAPPETFYRSAEGILHYAKKAPSQVLEEVCHIAIENKIYNYGAFKHMITSRASGVSVNDQDVEMPQNRHSQIRGKEYYK